MSIDKDEEDDIISYDESVLRILMLLIVLAMLLSFTALVLVITFYHERQQPRQLPWDKTPVKSNPGQFPTFNFLFINREGNITSFVAANNGLRHNWHFKIPESTMHYFFFDKGKLYFVHGDSNKEITYFNPFDISSHKTVPRSQLSFRINHLTTASFRVGDFYWIFGKYDSPFVTSVSQHFKSSIWSIRKQRWFDGPKIRTDQDKWYESKWHDICGISLNRTFSLVLTTSNDDSCIGFLCFLFSLDDFKLVQEECLPLFYFDYDAYELSCTSLVDKHGKVKVFIGLLAGDGDRDPIFRLFSLNGEFLKNVSEISVPVIKGGKIVSLWHDLYIVTSDALFFFDTRINEWLKWYLFDFPIDISDIHVFTYQTCCYDIV